MSPLLLIAQTPLVSNYMVSVEDADNGTIKVSPTRASKGSTVTINVTPDEGYELDKLVVTDKNGDTVKLTDKGSGTYTFKMPASKVTVEFSPLPRLPLGRRRCPHRCKDRGLVLS